jgi:hypothetical protein
MKKALSYLLTLVLFGIIVSAQTNLKKGDRPVLTSASTLARVCKDAEAVSSGETMPEGTNMSVDQIMNIAACNAYINGVFDQTLEGHGSHYNPVPSDIPWRKTLIDVFLKYVSDHPEEENLAASTVLAEAVKKIGDVQKSR